MPDFFKKCHLNSKNAFVLFQTKRTTSYIICSKGPETFRSRKASFRSSVSKNGEVYTPETSYMKGNSLHLYNKRIKQLCNRQFRDFAMALRPEKFSGLSRDGPQGSRAFKFKCGQRQGARGSVSQQEVRAASTAQF